MLFDLDGTLTDPLDGIANSLAYALERLGRPPVDRATVARLIGPPITEGYMRVLGMTTAQAEETLVLYRQYFSERGLYENVLYDGILELLRQLAHAGVRCAVATSKADVYAERIIEHFGMAMSFEFVGGSSLDRVRSTKADVIQHTMRTIGADPITTVMVGDRSHDVVGAAEHGLPCIGVLWGYGSARELRDAGALAVAATPAELARLLLPR